MEVSLRNIKSTLMNLQRRIVNGEVDLFSWTASCAITLAMQFGKNRPWLRLGMMIELCTFSEKSA
jgi:hypothetical protein